MPHQLRILISATVITLLSTALSACGERDAARTEPPTANSANAPASDGNAEAAPDAVVFSSFAVPPYELRLVANACTKEGDCPIVVQLFKERRLLDTQALPYSAEGRTAEVETEEVDARWGADPGLEAWSASPAEYDASTTARLVNLGPGVKGLLISQQEGYEHVGRNHVLLVPQQDKLIRAWEVQEMGSGPTISSTVLAPDGRTGFVVRTVTMGGYLDDKPFDEVTLSYSVWNADQQSLDLQDLPTGDFPVYLINAGGYPSLDDANSARRAATPCLSELWILDGARYTSLGLAPAFVGNLFERRAEAEAAVEKVAKCDPRAKPSLIEHSKR